MNYSISIKTSDVDNASTNNSVNITLHGTSRSLGPCDLDNGANNFEHGKIDNFVLNNEDNVGPIGSVTILWRVVELRVGTRDRVHK